MSERVDRRIVNVDIKNYNKDNLEEHGIFIHFDETNIRKAYILIIGPEGTPYENGYYTFNVDFPSDYPFKPPKMFFNCQSNICIHPNLYVNGKICLSILGTWSGPSWTSVMDINCVARSIQSLMSNKAIQNEPGFSSENGDICKQYDRIVWYENFNTYIINQYHNKNNKIFKNIILKHFKKNIKKNMNNLKNHSRYNKPSYNLYTNIYHIRIQENIKILEEKYLETLKLISSI